MNAKEWRLAYAELADRYFEITGELISRPINPATGLESDQVAVSPRRMQAFYVDEKMSVAEIALLLRCSDTTVRRILSDFDIPLRPRGAEKKMNKRKKAGQRPVQQIRSGDASHARRVAAGYPRNIPEERFLKLAAYEDSGLQPEEITAEPYGCVFYCNRKCNLDGDFCAEWPGCPYEIGAEAAKHLLELAQAEKDGRLVALPCDKVRWVKAILTERDRQDQKWGYPQKNSFCEWASIIAEEVGELSKELNFGRGTLNQMEAEAVQVAAVALSILEQSAVAHMVTVQVAVALSRLTREEAEAALKKREAGKIDTR